MAKRGDPEFLEVLVRQIRQDAKANVVLGKALSVLPQTELLQPFCNRLHRGRPADLVWPDRAIGPARQRALSDQFPASYVTGIHRPNRACLAGGAVAQQAGPVPPSERWKILILSWS